MRRAFCGRSPRLNSGASQGRQRQLTKRVRVDGECERFTLKGRGHAALGESASVAHPAERGSARECWAFWRQCMPVRQPEARRIRSGKSFGSANVGQFELTLL